ncbi:MAG: multidrug effflux MFS transporter [Notoacmeibacter sp.]|nr:multidrug effflux MFS transporter [Notoacmeibacter sp.]
MTLVLCAAVSPMAINIFVPSMPNMAGEFGVPYATIQLGMSLYLAMTALLTLIAGPLSDQYGRRPVIIGGFVLFLVGVALSLMASDITTFLAGRIIQASAASGMVLSRAIVRDVYERDEAASMIGYVTMGMSVAPMLGPAIGGFLDDIYGWRASFLLLGALGAVALLVMFQRLPETNMTRGRQLSEQAQAYRVLLTSPAYWVFAGTGSLAAAVFFGFLGGGPAIASNHLSMSASAYGLWFAACAAGYMFGNFIAGRYSRQWGIARMIMLGSIFALGGAVLPGILLGAGLTTPLALFGPTFFIGMGNGMVIPNATAGAVSVKPDAAGAASGLMGSLQVATGAVASVICSIAAGDGTHVVTFGFWLAGFGIAAALVALAAVRLARTL